MSKAQAIVKQMLEADYDAHVKAHQLVQKWDGAHRTFGELYKLKHKSLGLFREMGRAIGYERALARVGLTRDDVSHTISGAQIGSTDNYKQTRPVRRCQNVYCKDRSPKPEAQEACLNCGEPLKTTPMGYSFTDLHNKLAKHMLGVETNDGRRVWFDTPVPPQPELEPEEATEAKTPVSPAEFAKQGRLGKWW